MFSSQDMAVVDRSSKALFNSTKVNMEDETGDPVNFNLSNWGKIITFGSIKRQALAQGINPEVDPTGLNWAAIFREVYERTGERMRFALSPDSLFRFFQNRMIIYSQHFPDFQQVESAIDQMIRIYAINILKAEPNRDNSPYLTSNYCENSQGVAAPITTSATIQNLGTTTNGAPTTLVASAATLQTGRVPPLMNGATTSVASAAILQTGRVPPLTNGATTSVASAATLQTGRAPASTIAPTTASVAPTVTPQTDKLPALTTKAATSRKTTAASRTRAGRSARGAANKTSLATNEPEETCVAESSPTYQPRRIKRKYVDEEKQQKANSTKHATVEPLPTPASMREENKSKLLSLFKEFSQEGCFLQSMSASLALKVAEGRNQLLPYTFPAIEEQINNEEIADIKSLFGHFQSLLILCLLDGNKNEIPDAMVTYLKLFKEASLHDPPNATWRAMD